jgi:internalin A
MTRALLLVLLASVVAVVVAAPVPKVKDTAPTEEQLKRLKEQLDYSRGGNGVRSLPHPVTGEVWHGPHIGQNIRDEYMEKLPEVPFRHILYLFDCKVTDDGLEHIKPNSLLRWLIVHNTQEVTDDGMKHVAKLTRLTALSLTLSPIGDAGLKHLKTLTMLDTLELDCTKVTADGLTELTAFPRLTYLLLAAPTVCDAALKNLRPLTNLRHLRLHYDDRYGDSPTDAGMKHLLALKDLESLGLQRLTITDTGLKVVTELTKLRDLRVSFCDHVGDDGLKAILAANHQFERLEIGFSTFTDDGTNGLEKQADLREFDAHSSKGVGDATLERLAGLTRLERLDMCGTTVTDEGMKHIAKLDRLTYLNFNQTKVSDAGLKHLAGLTRLTRLQLDNTGVTDDAIDDLSKITTLTNLKLDGCPISADAAARLQKKLPKCIIYGVK